MANRKYRHNVNESRKNIGVNGDLSGYESMFMFQIESVGNLADDTPRLQIVDLFGNQDGNNTEELQFNWEFNIEGSDKKFAFDHNGNSINSINDAYAAPSVVTGLDTGVLPLSFELTGNLSTVYIKGQFNSLNYYSDDNGLLSPSWGADVDEAGNFANDEFELKIMQWGQINEIRDWERFGENHGGNWFYIEATDEPKFGQGVSLYKAFKGVQDCFSIPAMEAVNSWDSDKFGRLGRVFENGNFTGNINDWSFSGDDSYFAFYMRNNMDIITDKGEGMIPESMAGWAGFASASFSDSFQGATGIHNWEKVNSSQVDDMQYFAWENTRSKSLGTMRNLVTSKVENFTAMFGHAGTDAQGAEGELLIDPSNWDMKSAKTCFYMFGIESPNFSSWNGEINWKTMTNCIDIHSIVKNRTSYTGPRLDEFAPLSGKVVLFRSAFARTAINYDFSNWDFSGVDATRTDITYNENNASGIMGGFVRDCANMSLENTVKLLEACDRPFGQGGLPVSGVDPQIGTSVPNSFDFGTAYADNDLFGNYDAEKTADPTLMTRGAAARASLISKGYDVTGLDFLV